MKSEEVISLDGIWNFFYSPQKFTLGDALPERELFTGHMVTPGYWDDHYELFDEEDFFSLRARFNPDYRKPHFPSGTSILPHASSSFLIGSGFYRKQLSIPSLEEKRFFITVGPAMWGCFVFCNGKLAGNTTGYSVSSEFELTSFIETGKLNEIILVVCNVHDDGGAYCRPDGSHDGIPYGTRPGQHRGLAAQGYQSERAGIGDHTFLRITGSNAIRDAWLSFEDQKIHWHAELALTTSPVLTCELFSENRIICSVSRVCNTSEVEIISETDLPGLWSDREPMLYKARFKLIEKETLLDQRELDWGPRVLTVSGNRIAVNGNITYFRGATEHCYFAETCNPHFDKARYLHDLGILKKAGFNFIRCHTWCPPEQFYQACDELGIFVQTELPSVYSFEEAKAIFRHIRRHACAVLFCEGNEKKITDEVLERMKKLASIFRAMVPGALFNPQEALRMVEYEFSPERKIEQIPIPHDAARLADVAEFSDVYGSLGNGHFSYLNDTFPGPEIADYQHSHYKKPCLSHEIGILGGYLNFDLEEKYRNTFIGTGLFEAAREYMSKKGVYKNWKKYYQNNCRFISSIRKQLIENIRSCGSITGYDYLGAIDTHWHLTGYPCGIFDEFYQEKYGEKTADVKRYNGESILLNTALRFRNRFAGTLFDEKLRISFFGAGPGNIRGVWRFDDDETNLIARQEFSLQNLSSGNITTCCDIKFQLPVLTEGKKYTLSATAVLDGETIENSWTFWVFPAETAAETSSCRTSEKLTEELVDFVRAGGNLLLTGSFPCETRQETFRPHTSGRSLGHAGVLINEHPVWKKFPHESFADWQFYPAMTNCVSLIYDEQMPEYKPVLEMIPSFKLIRFKSLLSEFSVGRGRIMMCGLNLNNSDPAAFFLKNALLSYLNSSGKIPAPVWNPEDLKKRLAAPPRTGKKEIAIDSGGRPLW